MLLVFTLLAILVGIITTYSVIAHDKGLWPFNMQAQQNPDTTNTHQPTDKQSADSQDGKKNIPDDNNGKDSSSNTGDLKNIEVGVSFASVLGRDVEIRAFTPSVVESDGTCTALLTQGSATVLAESQAFIDSTTSQCQPIKIDLSEFTQSGTWNLFVSYKSAKSQGKSEIIEVLIP